MLRAVNSVSASTHFPSSSILLSFCFTYMATFCTKYREIYITNRIVRSDLFALRETNLINLGAVIRMKNLSSTKSYDLYCYRTAFAIDKRINISHLKHTVQLTANPDLKTKNKQGIRRESSFLEVRAWK